MLIAINYQVCRNHISLFEDGTYVLCPCLRDLYAFVGEGDRSVELTWETEVR